MNMTKNTNCNAFVTFDVEKDDYMKKRCPDCGHLNDEDDDVCAICGLMFDYLGLDVWGDI